MKTHKPTTPGTRGKTTITYRGVLTTNKPEKSLVKGGRKTAGRNSYGRITTRHHGGGHKRKNRLVDFKFDKKRSSVLTDILEDHNYDHGHEKHIASGNGSITSNVRNFNTSSESKPVAVMVEMRKQKNPLNANGNFTWVENPLK